jgi:hypothetical protein
MTRKFDDLCVEIGVLLLESGQGVMTSLPRWRVYLRSLVIVVVVVVCCEKVKVCILQEITS